MSTIAPFWRPLKMEFIGGIARKTGDPFLLAVEAAKTIKASEIGKETGLFLVPEVLNIDEETGVLDFERIADITSLYDLARQKNHRVHEVYRLAGRALALVHDQLILPDEMKHNLPAEWMDLPDENVFIHGDFGCSNVCLHEPSQQLVILDWSAAPLMGRTPTFGSRYFDILWFTGFMFRAATGATALRCSFEKLADAFLEGYAEVTSEEMLSKLGSHWPEMCRLQKKSIWYITRHSPLYRVGAYFLTQLFMYFRFWIYSRKFRQ